AQPSSGAAVVSALNILKPLATFLVNKSTK
ncbi:MAG: hypothetical protein ACI8R0_003278, partial [Alteromonadales bacterium]